MVDSGTVRSIERAFDILECVSENDCPVGIVEISKKTGLSKATAHRLATTLLSRGYIEKNSDGKYTVGSKLFEIAGTHINSLELQTEAKPFLSSLKHQLNLTSHLGILDGLDVVYIEKSAIYSRSGVYTQVGHRSPAYCSSIGKCLLACLSGEDLDYLLNNNHLVQYTKNTITDKNLLKKHLRTVRKQGWATDNQEYQVGHCCISSPIFDYRGEAIAAICVSGNCQEITENNMPKIIDTVKAAAAQLSEKMGYVVK